ncbi:MAG: SDR family oxidoreductase [Rhizobiales bacterium]|nr:SDR family oxidoreductase [Hyphomicrobiales bacterium]
MKKIALVTGAGTGVGKAAATELMRAGFHVVFAGRRLDVLEKAVHEAKGVAGQDSGQDSGKVSGEAFVCDVGDAAAVDRLFQKIEKDHGRIDVLFNNAGIFIAGKLIDEISLEEWQNAVDANLTGSFLCARAAFSLMRRQEPMGGRIINNGSISAHAPRPGSVPYTVTKHAITGLTKCLSLDGRAFDIACSQIDIGNAASDMAQPLSKGAKQADGSLMPEPLMDLEHVASAVRYMAELPLGTNVQFMTLMATKMPFVGRG